MKKGTDFFFRIICYQLFINVYIFSNVTKVSKTQVTSEVEVKSKENKSTFAKVNPSLYKKLIIEDLTSTGMHI